MHNIIIIIGKSLIVILSILIAVAYLTIVERKVLAKMQRRLGPQSVGIFGLLQPFADALKLFLKELILPQLSLKTLFIGAPIFTFVFSLIGWSIIPFNKGVFITDFPLGVLLLLAIGSLGIYGILFSGWSANSKYSLMGSLRSTAQMISYEVALGLLVISAIFISESSNLSIIVETQKSVYNIIPLIPIAIMFYISMLAETNRAPFDLPEAESELVSGFFTEHSAFAFAFFFLGEYGNMILISTLFSILFLGGYLDFLMINSHLALGIKVSLLLASFVWVRGTFPRFRYDNLISIMWKTFLPLSIGLVWLIPGIIVSIL